MPEDINGKILRNTTSRFIHTDKWKHEEANTGGDLRLAARSVPTFMERA